MWSVSSCGCRTIRCSRKRRSAACGDSAGSGGDLRWGAPRSRRQRGGLRPRMAPLTGLRGLRRRPRTGQATAKEDSHELLRPNCLRRVRLLAHLALYIEIRHTQDVLEGFIAGGPNESIFCFAEGRPGSIIDKDRDGHVDRCVWWGISGNGNGGASARSGHHITPVGHYIGESRGACRNDCPGPNPWEQFEMPPMAFYFWPDGSAIFHSTNCIDC